MLKVNHDTAKAILSETVGEVRQAARYTPKSKTHADIESVIQGGHLTYRYILMTGLLAKTVNGDVNPLALQAGAPFDGAYDARSLCHKVIVPLEATLLQNRLGGSNEPYLNKPARFTHLSEKNAVRKGKDLDTLKTSIHILSGIKNQREAKDALKDAIYFTLQRSSRLKSKGENILLSVDGDESVASLNLLLKLLEKSNEGESSTISAAVALKLLYSASPAYEVRVHPTNQAGTSSNEICDIDVLLNETHVYELEIKDKHYERHDVTHAIDKARENGVYKLLFIDGPRAKADFSTQEINTPDFSLHMLNIKNFLTTTLALCPPTSLDVAKALITEIAIEIRAKDLTFAWVEQCLIQ